MKQSDYNIKSIEDIYCTFFIKYKKTQMEKLLITFIICCKTNYDNFYFNSITDKNSSGY